MRDSDVGRCVRQQCQTVCVKWSYVEVCVLDGDVVAVCVRQQCGGSVYKMAMWGSVSENGDVKQCVRC